MEADKDRDGKISFEEFTKMVENTDVSMSMTLGKKKMMKKKIFPVSHLKQSPCEAHEAHQLHLLETFNMLTATLDQF